MWCNKDVTALCCSGILNTAPRWCTSTGANLAEKETQFETTVCYCTEMMNQQTPKKETDTHGCLTQSWAQGWELSFSILSSKPLRLFLKVIVCSRCPVFVLPGPPSHIAWPLLLTAAQFNLPNAVMGQVNQPPLGPSDSLWWYSHHSLHS